MEDQEIIDQAVRGRDGGNGRWASGIQEAVTKDCGECTKRFKRLHKAVMETPLPKFTQSQITKAMNAGTIIGFSTNSFDDIIVITRPGGFETRGILVGEET